MWYIIIKFGVCSAEFYWWYPFWWKAENYYFFFIYVRNTFSFQRGRLEKYIFGYPWCINITVVCRKLLGFFFFCVISAYIQNGSFSGWCKDMNNSGSVLTHLNSFSQKEPIQWLQNTTFFSSTFHYCSRRTLEPTKSDCDATALSWFTGPAWKASGLKSFFLLFLLYYCSCVL